MNGKNRDNGEIAVQKPENSHFNDEQMVEIKNMIKDVHDDIKNMLEKSNEDYLNLMYANLKNEFIGSMNGYMMDKIDPELDKRMVNPCDMREQCKGVFKKYLNEHTENLSPDNISNKEINKSRKELKKLEKIAQKEQCEVCFDEVSNIFENQVDLIKSFKMYDNRKDEDEMKISNLNVKKMVETILDPISHEKRLKILKAIALEPQSFSQLSKLTNLRGGNLIFHINKLQDNKLIFQKQSHGEYILSTKGFNLINLLLKIEK
jgi:DNA-binding HxlR family transcriptional regulator